MSPHYLVKSFFKSKLAWVFASSNGQVIRANIEIIFGLTRYYSLWLPGLLGIPVLKAKNPRYGKKICYRNSIKMLACSSRPVLDLRWSYIFVISVMHLL